MVIKISVKLIAISIVIGIIITFLMNDMRGDWIILQYFGGYKPGYQEFINDVFTLTGVSVYVGLILKSIKNFINK